jgi:hypothetical protein
VFGRLFCDGRLDVQIISDDKIQWKCLMCGDEGMVSDWKDLLGDVTTGDLEEGIH